MTARLTIEPQLFATLIAGLTERGRGNRESGAFLLTDRSHPSGQLPQPVTAIAFYDDLDPLCLTGAITFSAAGYTALLERCRRDGLRVVGDIHTHPHHHVRQSPIDAAHPMVALDGHVALIAPHYGAGVTGVAQLGVHLRVDGRWASFYGQRAEHFFHMPRPAVGRAPWWRRLLSHLRPRRRNQEKR
ncbi:hypothetical protein ACFQS1_35090 [Paractinoplanes rhizophilus]|uniref:JAB domain-containing protein n=1 Tax=Paractinoplanes rhizophilus TaxID=1416877 RepID=A0ABW2I302_9ACTN